MQSLYISLPNMVATTYRCAKKYRPAYLMSLLNVTGLRYKAIIYFDKILTN